MANDALRFIQDTRKTAGLDVSDRIVLTYSGSDEIIAAISAHQERIMHEALIVEMKPGSGEYATTIEGYELNISVAKA